MLQLIKEQYDKLTNCVNIDNKEKQDCCKERDTRVLVKVTKSGRNIDKYVQIEEGYRTDRQCNFKRGKFVY
jgi:hypothetical protein